MATRTWQLKALDRVLNVKMKKDEAENLYHYSLCNVLKIQAFAKQITGTVMPDGTTADQHEMVSMTLFGMQGTLSDEGIQERKELIASLPDLITYENVAEVKAKCAAFFDKYLTVKDERKTLVQRTEARAKANAFDEERKAKEAEDNRVLAERSAELRAQYPELMILEDSGKSSQVVAAENTRRQLAKTFPGQKFSVTSESFSMGDAVDIRWTDGPTIEEVEAITKHYKEGYFDGMDDMYHDVDSPWHIFGHSKYINESRRISPERYREVATEMNVPVTVTDEHGAVEGKHEDVQMVKRATWARSFYVKPEPGIAVDIPTNGDVILTRNEERDGIELKFNEKPKPAILETLKANGFRWSRFQSLWWARYTDERMSIAQQIAGQVSQ